MKIISTEVKNLDAFKTIAIPHVGEYSGIAQAFNKLFTWAGENNLLQTIPQSAGVYLDDPANTPVDKLRSKACLEDHPTIELAEGMERYTISGGKYFVMQVQVVMSKYQEAWLKAYSTFNEQGYEYDVRDHYELYVSYDGNPCDENTVWTTDLCIPMK